LISRIPGLVIRDEEQAARPRVWRLIVNITSIIRPTMFGQQKGPVDGSRMVS